MNCDRLDYSNSLDPDEVVYESGPRRYGQLPKSSVLDISHELQRLNLHSDIIVEACDEYDRLNMKFRRGRRWDTALFHCIDAAHRSLSIPTEPKYWMNTLGITMKDLNAFVDKRIYNSINIDMDITDTLMFCRCVDECQCEILGESHVVFMDPSYFIEDYCNQLDMFVDEDIHIDRMTSLSDIAKKYVDDYPQVIACGVILYYCRYIDHECPRDELVEVSQKSQQSIMKVVRVMTELFSDPVE